MSFDSESEDEVPLSERIAPKISSSDKRLPLISDTERHRELSSSDSDVNVYTEEESIESNIISNSLNYCKSDEELDQIIHSLTEEEVKKPLITDKRFADICEDTIESTSQSRDQSLWTVASDSVIALLSDDEEEGEEFGVGSAEVLSIDSNDSIVLIPSTTESDLSLDSIIVQKGAKVKSTPNSFKMPAKQKSPPKQWRRKDIVDVISDEDLNRNTRRSRREEHKRLNRLRHRLDFMSSDSPIDSDIDSEEPFDYILHKNDFWNNPENDGRVLVNIGHPFEEPDIWLDKGIAETVKAHQIGGIRFVFDNLVESVDRFESTEGFGCILSHSMGLGKTIQIIAVIDVMLRHTSAKSVLIILPINVMNNWSEEFNLWLPDRQFEVISIDNKGEKRRNKAIIDWHSKGGVLLVGYEKYFSIFKHICDVSDHKEKYSREVIRNASKLRKALVDPGPDVVVCDEGHKLKNDSAGISQAVKEIKTKRRVVLTGYPLQNQLLEYYCMIDFIRPQYLGHKWEFKNAFENPITNGQCKDSTDEDKRLMRERSHVLNELLKGFIQRRTESVLETSLPSKQDIVVFCRLCPFQRQLIYHFLEDTLNNTEREKKISLFKTFVVCSKICNHSDIIYNIFRKANGVDTEDLDPELNQQLISYSWAESHFEDYVPEVLENSNKMVVLFEIIDKCVAIGDKLLVFSQWVFTLDLMETLLRSREVSHSGIKWRRDRNYYRLDGQTKANEREGLIKQFNSKDSPIKLFLISTKAGGIGVNLIGANRIVIYDSCWNPCHDAQAACRAYRFGQTKKCFIYRLISDNSLEKRVFNKQIFKQVLFDRVVDQNNGVFALNQSETRALLVELRRELEVLDTKPEIEVFSEEQNKRINDFNDSLLTRVCHKRKGCLTDAPFDHKSLFHETNDLELNSEEKRKAVKEFTETQKMNLNLRPNYQHNSRDEDNSPINQLTERLKKL